MTIILSTLGTIVAVAIGGWVQLKRTAWYIEKRMATNPEMRVGQVFKRIHSGSCDVALISDCYLVSMKKKRVVFDRLDGTERLSVSNVQFKDMKLVSEPGVYVLPTEYFPVGEPE